MYSSICPGAFIALRLSSETIKVVQVSPNTTISIGKYGSFQANQILGRPYYLTFEILEKAEGKGGRLRVVSAPELHTEFLTDEHTTTSDDLAGEPAKDGAYVDVDDVVGEVLRTNRETIDDSSRQTLSMEEIEALKKDATATGKEIIDKILESHTALDQKTAFSLAKYTLRKRQKYLRRFTVLPLDVPTLTHWLMTEKDASKIMEVREEMIGLIGCWANVHYGGSSPVGNNVTFGRGRWLVVDETGGLIVAAMAERMGILHPEDKMETGQETSDSIPEPLAPDLDEREVMVDLLDYSASTVEPSRQQTVHVPSMSSLTNNLTLIHPNTQPNLSLLSHFSFNYASPSSAHPLYSHLRTLSWLQLLSPLYLGLPYSDPQPETFPSSELATMRPNKRSNYNRKHRRWNRTKMVVDETRAGHFDGLIVASFMEPRTIMEHLVPLLAGGAQICIYSPSLEPLVELADLYSTSRRTAFINSGLSAADLPTESFPLNPTLLLSPSIQTIRARPWQVLPGRTHPRMIGRGGAEGYLFHAHRVVPAEGRVEARGKKGGGVMNAKRRKTEEPKEQDQSGVEAGDDESKEIILTSI